MEMKLTIKRVPTVVSNYQDDADKPRAGCGRNCLGDCCLPGEPPTTPLAPTPSLRNSLFYCQSDVVIVRNPVENLGIIGICILDPVPF
jgi:hypothetical protein